MLHNENVDKDTLALVRKLSSAPMLGEFALVGGTALSLQIGHRNSSDIDLFTKKPFNPQLMANYIVSKYQPQEILAEKGVFFKAGDVRVGLVTDRNEWLKPFVNQEGVRMASLEDISAMKIHAIVQSGKKVHDFFDLFALLERYSLNNIIDFYAKKYPAADPALAKKAILYHNDVELNLQGRGLGAAIKWSDVASRCKLAFTEPDKIFKKMVTLTEQQRYRNKQNRL